MNQGENMQFNVKHVQLVLYLINVAIFTLRLSSDYLDTLYLLYTIAKFAHIRYFKLFSSYSK